MRGKYHKALILNYKWDITVSEQRDGVLKQVNMFDAFPLFAAALWPQFLLTVSILEDK